MLCKNVHFSALPSPSKKNLSVIRPVFCFILLWKAKKPKSGYKCTECDEEHNDLDGLHQHLLLHALGNGVLQRAT